jgi:hypothetical protein
MLLFFSFIFFITVSPIGIFFFILLDIAVFCDIFLIPSAIKKENFKIMASLGIDPTEVR